MSVQAVFIVDKVENTLIFLEYLEESIKKNQKELSNVLGKIVNNCKGLKANSFSNLEIKENYFFSGIFDKILLIVQHSKGKTPPEEFLIELYNIFVQTFENILKNYTKNDLSKFRSFAKDLKELIPKYFHNSNKQELIDLKPIIDPIERDFYPERPSVYKRDEILYNEAKLIKQEYATKFVDGFIFKLDIYVSISPNQWYKIYIDFSDYPLRPKVAVDDILRKGLGVNLDNILYFYKTWDKKRPPHIIEIIKELETILLQYHSKGRLSKISSIPKEAIPEVRPLPNIE